MFIRCHDCTDPINNYQIPRGRAGVAIAWPSAWDKYVSKLEDGNERILCIELKSEVKPTCIINAYMPTNSSNSTESYQECLDIIYDIISAYDQSHNIILCGDLNGTLKTERNNKHDLRLKRFTSNLHLKPSIEVKNQPTYYHNDGKSTFQIDYILTSNDIIRTTTIYHQDPINTSTHVPVRAKTSIKLNMPHKKNLKSKTTAYRLSWEKADKSVYQSELIKHLNLLPHSNITTNDKLLHLIGSIHQATKIAVPSNIIRLKGPKRKASPMVSKLIGISKNKHRIWNNAGRPKNGHTLFLEKKRSKKKAEAATTERNSN